MRKMKIMLSESQYFKVMRLVNEEEEEIDIIDEPTKYTYLSVNPWQKGTTKKYFFNKVRTVPDKSPIPGKIKLVGNRGEFIFNKSDLRFNVEKETISVDQWLLDKDFNLGVSANEPQNLGITPNNIRKALSLAFPNNWMSEDDTYSAGLRGVYTIGDKINDQTEDWSIMNYFDTKPEIHDLIFLRYKEQDSNEDIIDWMIDLFKNDDAFTQLLVDRQWQSIENGLKLERDSVKYLLTKLKSASITFYPHGSKMDRWYGIDVTINGINCQVKPLTSYSEKDGVYTVFTYGMRDYSSKKMVNKIIFANNKEILIFDNKNYSVNSRSNATFNEQPKIVK
jgi:hypothetical protein